MIYYSIAFDSTKNVGKYYNQFISILPNDDDYACFIDGDATFTTYTFGKQLEDVVEQYPEAGVFVGITNRVGCKWQVAKDVKHESNDIAYHRQVGQALQDNKYLYCEDVTYKPKLEVLSGVLMMIKKSAWKIIGGIKDEGMLGIDNDVHWKCQEHDIKIYKMEGFYVYHWYRGEDPKNKQHLL